MMLINEVVEIAQKVPLIMVIVYVVATHKSFEALVNSLSKALIGRGVPTCRFFFHLEIFAKVFEVIGSFNVAFYRSNTIIG